MLPEEKYPLDEMDIKRMWASFPGSPVQHVLHNELAKLIHDERNKFEDCTIETFPALQAAVKAYKKVQQILHRHDARDVNPVRRIPAP